MTDYAPNPETPAQPEVTPTSAIAELLAANAKMLVDLEKPLAPDATDTEMLARLRLAAIANIQNISALAVLMQEMAMAFDDQFNLVVEAVNAHGHKIHALENPKRIITL